MSLIAARDLLPGQSVEVDLCIVGSGPAGLTVAHALDRRGLDICVIESGSDAPNERFQALNDLESLGHPIRESFIHRLRMLGGTTNLWAGRCMPLEAIDFEARDWVPGSGWPVSFEQYLPYAYQAGLELGLPPRFVERVAAGAPEPAPEPARPLFPASVFSKKIALWAKRPPNAWHLFGPHLARSSRCQVIHGLTLTGLRLNTAGTSVERMCAAASDGGAAFDVRARRYVLAMGGIENTRTLLLGLEMNPQAHYPREPLGRWYMDHPRALHGRVRLNPGVDFTHYLGRPVTGGMMQACVGLSFSRQRVERLLNSYVYFEIERPETFAKGYDTGIQVMKRVLRRGYVGRRFDFSPLPSVDDLIYLLTPRELAPHLLYRMYFNTRARLRLHRRDLVILNHCEQVPDPDSRISLGSATDSYGNRLARLDWRVHPLEVDSLVRLHQDLDDWLKNHGLGRLLTDPAGLHPGMLADASHHLGGTRMSADPRTGVVDANLRVHGISNLYVCGSSVFPTSGSGNPTWSIVAFALRLAEHLHTVGRRDDQG
jgi:hypothetical protein